MNLQQKKAELNLQQKKAELLRRLESLKSDDLLNNSSVTRFNFLGKCGQKHAVETKLNSTHGILSGDFIQVPCEKGCCQILLVCVGIGDGCNSREGEFLWFLSEYDNGISNVNAKTLEELKLLFNIKVIS